MGMNNKLKNSKNGLTFTDNSVSCIATVTCAGIAALCVCAGGVWVAVVEGAVLTLIDICMYV